MRYLIFLAFIICSLVASGQSNLVFFTEEGEKFTLYINGSQSNETPAARVKATGITADFAQIKIIFETPGAPELKKGMMLEPNKELTAIIKKSNKGKYILRPVGTSVITTSSESETVPITNAGASTSSQTGSTSTSSNNETVGINVSMGDQSVGVSVSMNNMDQAEMNLNSTNRTVNEPGNIQQLSARVEGKKIILGDGRVYTFNYYNANRIGPVVEMKNPAGAQASISYEGVESFASEIPFQYNEEDWKKSKAYFKLTVTEGNVIWSVKLKHSGKIIIDGPTSLSSVENQALSSSATSGCTSPMASSSYDRSKASIQAKSFSDEQLTVFKQIVRANCFSVTQVIGFIDLFTYEEEKLEVAKLAYPKTVDKGNYYQVNDAFTYSDTVEELEDFLSKQ